MENIPNKIYLQIGDADVTIDHNTNDFNDLFKDAITWADERINENDIEYERRSAALPTFDVRLSDLLGLDNPYSLKDVVGRLKWATEYLLIKKSYDGHNYEELEQCVRRANEILKILEGNFY